MATIKVPETVDPTLCLKHPPLVGSRDPMVVCTKPKNHPGPHSWEEPHPDAR